MHFILDFNIHSFTHCFYNFKVYLTSDTINAVDDSNRPDEISFEVVSPPQFGRIQYVSIPGVAIQMFSQLDLLARNVRLIKFDFSFFEKDCSRTVTF